MTGEQSIDHSIAAAWEEFRSALVRTLRELEPGAFSSLTIVEATYGQIAPYLQFFKADDGSVVLSEVSSNQVLTGDFRLSPGQIGELLRIGWAPPSPPSDDPQIPNFHLVDSDLEAAVARAQETLQSVFGLPHPDFLAPAPSEDELHGVEAEPEGPDDGEEASEDDELPEELIALIHLENDESVELDPQLVATLMRGDRAFILHCIRLAEEQMISWAAGAEDEDDPEEIDARLYESRGWEETVSTLRRALHAVVTNDAARGRNDADANNNKNDDDDEVAELEFMEQMSAWALSLDDEIGSLEPGETLFVTVDASGGGPRATLSVSRYLDTGVLGRIIVTRDAIDADPDDDPLELAAFGWHPVPAAGATGPARLVKLADTMTPGIALACLSGLVHTGCVASLDDLSIGPRTDHGDWRRLPHHTRVDGASFDDLRSSVTTALEDLGAHPALLPGIRLETSAANHSVTVEIDTQAPRLHVVGPVVADPDPALVEGGSATLPDSGFDWVFDGERVVLDARMDASPFHPGHLEIVLAAAEDVILVHSRPLAAELGGTSAIEDYLAESAG